MFMRVLFSSMSRRIVLLKQSLGPNIDAAPQTFEECQSCCSGIGFNNISKAMNANLLSSVGVQLVKTPTRAWYALIKYGNLSRQWFVLPNAPALNGFLSYFHCFRVGDGRADSNRLRTCGRGFFNKGRKIYPFSKISGMFS